MKFKCSVEIDAPRDFAAQLFANKDHFTHWQPDFQGVESIEGPVGQPGTRTHMKYQNGKHQFDLYETVKANNLPEEFIGEYETPGTCWNSMCSRFQPLGDHRTLFEAEIEYRFTGFMIKIMALVMPGMFKKQTQRYLDNFKVFVEKQDESK